MTATLETETKTPAAVPPTPTPAPAPEVPDKYKGPDGKPDLAKILASATEAERKITEQATELAKLRKGETPVTPTPTNDALKITPTEPPIEDMDLEGLLTKAEIDQKDFADTYNTTGALKPEHYNKLRKVLGPVSNKIIDSVARGLKAEAKLTEITVGQNIQKAQAAVGGEQQFNAFKAAAPSLFEPAELQRWQRMIDADSAALIDFITVTKTRYAVKHGGKQPVISGTSTVAASAEGVTTWKEWRELSKKAEAGDVDAYNKIKATKVKDLK